MKTYHLDAATIDPSVDPATFLCEFYHVEPQDLLSLRKTLFASDEIRQTQVFNWPINSANWKPIADTLEYVQQHSPNFYVIWGPETENAILFDEKRLEENELQSAPKKEHPNPKLQ